MCMYNQIESFLILDFRLRNMFAELYMQISLSSDHLKQMCFVIH